jgi:HK97 family phage major capsid protein
VRADKGAPRMEKKTLAERITEYEHTRAAKVARLEAIQQKATDDNRTKTEAEREEFDNLNAEIKSIDAELVDLRGLERMAITKATPIMAGTPEDASKQRGGIPVVQVTSPLPKGTGFIRYCQALACSRGSTLQAVEYAKRWHDSTPEVELVLKAAVAAGTTTDATWAGPLAPIKPLTDEFIAYLRPATILGRVPSFMKVPFNVSVAAQTGGGTYQWVGQGAPKPVGKLAFATLTLGITKCAGIIVITEELARNSSPDAEDVIRRDMVAGIAQFLDTEFIDPSKAAVAGVSPGSVTNGVTPITTAGTTPANARTDIQALANAMTALNISTAGAVLVLSETNALALTNALNPLGQPLFPGMAQEGGTIMGYKAVASQAAGTTVALIKADQILYADDGGVTIDVSREASLQMDSAPMAVPDATTVLTSLWQMNYVGLRAERFINWKKARTGVVQYTVATYAA